MKNFARHSALAATAVTWTGSALIMLLHKPDIHDAISQYSRYADTRVAFGLILTFVAVCTALFGLYLRKFWQPSFYFMLAAAGAFIVTAWSPYDQAQFYAYWLHNISFYVAVFCYAFACWRCTVPIHSQIGAAFLIALTVSSQAAGIAVLAKHWSMPIEAAFMIIAQAWTLLLAYAPNALRRAFKRQEILPNELTS